MTAVSWVLLMLACAGTLYYALSGLALVARSRRPFPPDPRPLTSPSISVLKPVCGVDASLRENLRSFVEQEYPEYEVLFGVLEEDDPAIPVLRESGEVMIGSEIGGANNKVRILHSLAKHATGEILVIADADTRVEPGFLRRIVVPFENPSVGAVTCLYRGVSFDRLRMPFVLRRTQHEAQGDGSGLRMSFDRLRMKGVADALEGLHMTCVFAPGVACAERMGGIDFGLGAAIAIRRSVLDEIGGFESIADHLADDFQLGRKAAEAGYRVVLSDYVIEIVLCGESLRSVLARELRWSRTTRVSRPAGHFGLVLTFGFVYALLFLMVSGFPALGWGVLLGVGLVRMVTAYVGAVVCLGDVEFPRRAWLLPVRDVLSFGVWVTGYLSRTVSWRGRCLKVMPGGKMSPVGKG